MDHPGFPSSVPEPDPTGAAAERYRERARQFRASQAAEATRSRRISSVRLLVFLGVVAALLTAERGGPRIVPGALVAALLLGLAFVVLLAVHRRIRKRERHAAALAAVNEEGLLRLARRWNDLPPEPWGTPPPDRPEAEDLDLLGPTSLFRLLGPPASLPGREALTRRLLDGTPPDEIPARQEAVRILAPRVDLRDELGARGRTLDPGTPGEVERFLAWAEGEPWLPGRRALRAAAFLLPGATAVLGIAHLQGLLPPLWVLPLLATMMTAFRITPPIHARFDAASAGESGVRRYGPLLELATTLPSEGPLLDELRSRLGKGDRPAHAAIASLRRVLDVAEMRRSMLGPYLQWTLLWDVHVLDALERWQGRHGRHVRDWLEVLGEVEALAALARLSHDHPHWGFPEVRLPASDPREGPELRATALGHPLLPPDRCVRNDVTVGPPGTLLLVTGSNMSGKSTLLRALGTNATLAGAGGPVCADTLEMPPLRVATCIRVRDALEEGVSLFMAELYRLRAVVEAARDADGTGRTVLYLLDEILQGTNTAERQVASRHILEHLLATESIGAVTTHDLTLAATPELSDRTTQVHFRETVERGPDGTVLSFDYRLRPGPATSRNALRLLEAVGLGTADPAAGALPDP